MEILLVPPKDKAFHSWHSTGVVHGQCVRWTERSRKTETGCTSSFFICMKFKRIIEGFFVMRVFTVVSSILIIYDWPSKQIPAFQKEQYVNKHSRLTKKTWPKLPIVCGYMQCMTLEHPKQIQPILSNCVWQLVLNWVRFRVGFHMWPLFKQKTIVSITCCVATSGLGTWIAFKVLALILIPTFVPKHAYIGTSWAFCSTRPQSVQYCIGSRRRVSRSGRHSTVTSFVIYQLTCFMSRALTTQIVW